MCVVLSVSTVLLVEELSVPFWNLPVLTYSFMIQTMLWWNMVIQLLQARLLAQSVLTSLQQVSSAPRCERAPRERQPEGVLVPPLLWSR